MKSMLLLLSSRFLAWPFFIISIWILYRGHNLPGGGFIGGLIGAAGFLFYDLSGYGRPGRGLFSFQPLSFLVLGLSIAVASGLPGLFAGAGFMKGYWLPGFDLPLLGSVHLGTPMVFDIGVYLTVIGFVLLLAGTMADDMEKEEIQ
jgi:multicomponent Na+:H+ antiporter subunit B